MCRVILSDLVKKITDLVNLGEIGCLIGQTVVEWWHITNLVFCRYFKKFVS